MVRSSSISKPVVQAFEAKGITIKVGDSLSPVEDLVEILRGIDVLINTHSMPMYEGQKNIVIAAKKAGVKRIVPSAWIPTIAPGGLSKPRDDVSARNLLFSSFNFAGNVDN